MTKVVAVEDNLRPFKKFLEDQGCRLVDMKQVNNSLVDAVVLSGSDENIMGMQDLQTEAIIINARGKTPQQVWDYIRNM
ncbi:MAG: YkuS family protein [Syntrophomonadaceae bacterium]|jgi:hypothetical protein